MTESPLMIATADGFRAVASIAGGGIPTGLALTQVRPDDDPEGGRWSITHTLSGKRIGPGFTELRHAREVALYLWEVADWTRPDLETDRELAATVQDILTRAIGEVVP